MRNLTLLLAFGFLVLLGSCKQDKITAFSNDCPDFISFQESIEPMINTNCSTSGCHAAGFNSPELVTYEDIANNTDIILNRLQKDPTDSQLMPLGGPKLADSLIQQFKCWVAQGALDN